MNIRLDDDNYMKIDQKNARIIQLKLSGKIIIKQILQELGSGNYLMYPWVNRVQNHPYTDLSHPFSDGNGVPLHGFYVNEERQITISSPKQNTICIECKPLLKLAQTPLFKEILTLQKGKLTINFNIIQQENSLPVCFGYHPYIQIDEQDLENMKIQTDIKTQIQLQQSLLPVYPYQKKEVQIKIGQKYDSLFQGGSYFDLIDQTGFTVRLTSELPFWQIYTPPDGKRIAVQPMSFTANLYKIQQTNPSPLLKSGFFAIQAKNKQ